MKVIIERDNEEKELAFAGEAKKLLKQLELNKETVLIVRNGTLVTEDEILENTDEVTLLSIISGG